MEESCPKCKAYSFGNIGCLVCLKHIQSQYPDSELICKLIEIREKAEKEETNVK